MSNASLEAMKTSKEFQFPRRHIGPQEQEQRTMLEFLGHPDLETLVTSIIPAKLREDGSITLPPILTETECLAELKALADQNEVKRSFLGLGYQAAITPTVILRNVLENPGWYTQYTPYQAEISQGRLEALLNFQTMVCDLTGLSVANASLLDEGTAAAEAMTMALRGSRFKGDSPTILIDSELHPQTIEVIKGRAIPLGISVQVQTMDASSISGEHIFGAILAYPGTEGQVRDWTEVCRLLKDHGKMSIAVSDLLSLVPLKSPADMGFDICVGSTQRFGLPLGFGGPHAAYLACGEAFKRQLPGRIVGVSQDRRDKPALRLALQTREQHIRRDRATSNICTAQVLPAIIASMYAVYHGAKGLQGIVDKLQGQASVLAHTFLNAGHKLTHQNFFDTIKVEFSSPGSREAFLKSARDSGFNVRSEESGVVIALDERTTELELQKFADILGVDLPHRAGSDFGIPASLKRTNPFLTHRNFHDFHSEHEMLRYLKRLENKDLSLAHSMIPLGSCTMKLNASSEMIPISWPGFADIHPAAPSEQTQGYRKMLRSCEEMLCEITGFDAMSLQPNAGSQGEYAGLLAIRAYHASRGDEQRKKILIPVSAHGTNPASAILAGFETVGVKCDEQGNIDVAHLREQAQKHAEVLGGLMITYPSTHGVFEETLPDVIATIHEFGGQVYLDGANFNAMVGWCRPGKLGADVCHLNLHKTFCIPHGGGGPGMGPIGVRSHLAPFLPGHPWSKDTKESAILPVSAAPWGSASIMPIVWAYLRMMGGEGLKDATSVAILNANYLAKKLSSHYDILYTGRNDSVAHECILDLRPFKARTGVDVEDVAKRLVDYSFHAPTMSWPVAGTLMVEPTESEGLRELDRFIEAMRMIAEETKKVESGEWDRADNPLKMAPHTAEELISDEWSHPYSREVAAYPSPGLRSWKFWPGSARINNAAGDRNLVCSCAGWDPDV